MTTEQERYNLDSAINELLSMTIATTLEETIKEVASKHSLDHKLLRREFDNHVEGYGEIGN